MVNRYTAVFEQIGEWWIGYAEELPGANVQERTLEEARESLKEAIQLKPSIAHTTSRKPTMAKW